MSKFTDFVNTELPQRPVLIKGQEEAMGDPNLSELQKINDAPIGSFYMQFDAGNKLWQKTAEGKEGWTVVGGSSGSGGPLDPNLQALMEKKIIIPKIYTSEDVVTTDSIKIPTQEDEEIVIGSVNIVDQSTGQIIIRNGMQVTGTINEEGEVFFNQAPRSDIRIVYGVKVLLNELPEDFLKRHFYTDDDERNMLTIIDDINELEKDLIKENIKPTGLYTNTTEKGTTITFSYTDDPNLDYFVLERFDEATGRWVPYDGKEGIIIP